MATSSNAVARLAGGGTSGSTEDLAAYGRSLGLSPQEVAYAQSNGWTAEDLGLWSQQPPAARQQEVAQHEAGQDLNKPRSNTLRSNQSRAEEILGRNVMDAQGLASTVSSDMGDYTYEAAQDRGAGYQLPDRISQYGGFDPLQASLQEQAINQTRTDRTGLDAQTDVLGTYKSLYNQGGLDDQDRARMEMSRRMRSTQARGAEQAIMADAAEKGRMGGNAQLLGRLQAQQGGANMRAMDDLQTNALALSRRQSLLEGQAHVGNQIQTAQDAIDAFNTLGERDRAVQNLQRENAAKELNFNETNTRDRGNTDNMNAATTTQFTTDSDRSSANTDRTNDARQFNVGPQQGARGMFRDRGDALGLVTGARGSVAELIARGKGKKSSAEAGWDAFSQGIDAGNELISFGSTR